MFTELNHLLDCFDPLGLDDIDRVRLMDRIDTKYVFPVNKVADLLDLMKPDYKILEINGLRISEYETIYLDTPDYVFFNQHITGRTGRLKVRFRQYSSTGITFLEIKKKTKKNRTIKWRIESKFSDRGIDNAASEFIVRHIPEYNGKLSPVLRNNFKRATFVNLNAPERLTLDIDLSFDRNGNMNVNMPYIAIAELKSEVFASRSFFSLITKQLGIYQTGFSKYCIGSAFLYDLPRKNILKPKILFLKRIENECNESFFA